MISLLPPLALSVRQPWAWALFNGKDIENRSEYASRFLRLRGNGEICIHASKGMTRKEYEDAAAFMLQIGVKCPRPDQLTRGAIIGKVRVTEIVTHSESPWFFGPTGLCIAYPQTVDQINLPGALGYFDWQAMLMKSGDGVAAEKPLPWMVAWPQSQISKTISLQRTLI